MLMGAARGEMELTVTSAAVSLHAYSFLLLHPLRLHFIETKSFRTQKLDEKTLRRIETAIGRSQYSEGKKLKLVTKVNPEILGSVIVEIGERTIDYSVASRVSRMNKLLTETI